MNTRKFYAMIDARIDSPDFDRAEFSDWLEDQIEKDLGRSLSIEEVQMVCVVYYAGALRGAKQLLTGNRK